MLGNTRSCISLQIFDERNEQQDDDDTDDNADHNSFAARFSAAINNSSNDGVPAYTATADDTSAANSANAANAASAYGNGTHSCNINSTGHSKDSPPPPPPPNLMRMLSTVSLATTRAKRMTYIEEIGEEMAQMAGGRSRYCSTHHASVSEQGAADSGTFVDVFGNDDPLQPGQELPLHLQQGQVRQNMNANQQCVIS
jgi:hypothetical protein